MKATWPDMAVLGFIFVTTALLLPVVISLWRGSDRAVSFLRRARDLGISETLVLFGARGCVAFVILMPLLGVGIILALVQESEIATAIATTLRFVQIAGEVCEWSILITAGLYGCALNFGRPKWVFPRVLREGPGLIT